MIDIIPKGFIKVDDDTYFNFYKSYNKKRNIIVLFYNYPEFLRFTNRFKEDSGEKFIRLHKTYTISNKKYIFEIVKNDDCFNRHVKGKQGNLIISTKVPEVLINMCLTAIKGDKS